MQIFEKSKFTQLEMTKGSIASLVLTQYFDLLENSLSCGTFVAGPQPKKTAPVTRLPVFPTESGIQKTGPTLKLVQREGSKLDLRPLL